MSTDPELMLVVINQIIEKYMNSAKFLTVSLCVPSA